MEQSPRELLAKAARSLVSQGLAIANEGNLSMKIEDNTLLVTPAGLRKNELCPETLVACNLEGLVSSGGTLSSEFPLHQAIYKNHPKVTGVVHGHPPVATALGLTGRGLEQPLLAEAVVLLGPVPVVPFSLPASCKLAQDVAQNLRGCHGVILKNHGAVTVGYGENGLETALLRMEVLEQNAKILLFGHLLGTPEALPKSDLAVLENMAEGYGLASLNSNEPGQHSWAQKTAWSSEDWRALAHNLLHRFQEPPQGLEE